MNAAEMGQKIAALMKQRDAEHAAAVTQLRELIIQLSAKVDALPAPRDGRDGLPGLPGPPGEKGESGKDGRDGADGTSVTYQGIYDETQMYERGALVTYSGSLWHADEITNEKPGAGKGWTLAVKKGRDGKDARELVR